MLSIHEQAKVSIYHIEKAHYRRLNLINLEKDYWTLSFVLDGELTTRLGGEETRVHGGDVMIHPPNTRFSEVSGRKGTHIYMHFDVKLSPGISFFRRFPMPHVVRLSDSVRFAAGMEELLRICRDKASPMRQVKVVSLTLRLLGEIYESARSTGSEGQSAGSGSDADRFAQLIVYMEDHLQQKLQREDLARQVHLHPSYFNRAFKSVYGMSALQMLKKIRLRRATAMLEETDFTLDAIAEGCGFSDAAYFSRIFRRHMGQTPGDYRRSVANAKIRFIKES